MSDIAQARRAIDEAIDALSLECWRGSDREAMQPVSGPDCTIVIELERVDRALGPRGQSMFAPIAAKITQAVIALYEARAALKEPNHG